MAGALGLVLAIPGTSGHPGPERLTCATLAARLPDLRRQAQRVAIEDTVRRVEAEGAPQQIALCGGGTPTVLCVTEAAEDRQVGERLLVTGIVSEAGAGYLRLEPCEHRSP